MGGKRKVGVFFGVVIVLFWAISLGILGVLTGKDIGFVKGYLVGLASGSIWLSIGLLLYLLLIFIYNTISRILGGIKIKKIQGHSNPEKEVETG